MNELDNLTNFLVEDILETSDADILAEHYEDTAAEFCQKCLGWQQVRNLNALFGNPPLIEGLAIMDKGESNRYLRLNAGDLSAVIELVRNWCIPLNAHWSLSATDNGDCEGYISIPTGRFLIASDIEAYGHSGTPCVAILAACVNAQREINLQTSRESEHK